MRACAVGSRTRNVHLQLRGAAGADRAYRGGARDHRDGAGHDRRGGRVHAAVAVRTRHRVGGVGGRRGIHRSTRGGAQAGSRCPAVGDGAAGVQGNRSGCAIGSGRWGYSHRRQCVLDHDNTTGVHRSAAAVAHLAAVAAHGVHADGRCGLTTGCPQVGVRTSAIGRNGGERGATTRAEAQVAADRGGRDRRRRRQRYRARSRAQTVGGRNRVGRARRVHAGRQGVGDVGGAQEGGRSPCVCGGG